LIEKNESSAKKRVFTQRYHVDFIAIFSEFVLYN